MAAMRKGRRKAPLVLFDDEPDAVDGGATFDEALAAAEAQASPHRVPRSISPITSVSRAAPVAAGGFVSAGKSIAATRPTGFLPAPRTGILAPATAGTTDDYFDDNTGEPTSLPRPEAEDAFEGDADWEYDDGGPHAATDIDNGHYSEENDTMMHDPGAVSSHSDYRGPEARDGQFPAGSRLGHAPKGSLATRAASSANKPSGGGRSARGGAADNRRAARERSRRAGSGTVAGLRSSTGTGTAGSAALDPGARAAAAAAGKSHEGPKASSGKPSLHYSRRGRAVEYTPHTLDQYKALRSQEGKYVELGKLGPDMSSAALLEAQARRRKTKEYARKVSKTRPQLNGRTTRDSERRLETPATTGMRLSGVKEEPLSMRPLPEEEERRKREAKKQAPSARRKALEFAKKNVPKPTVRQTATSRHSPGKAAPREAGLARTELERLEAEHDRMRAAVADIRKLV